MRLEQLEFRRLFAAAGELDPGFGEGGVVDLVPRAADGDIAALPDGRVLVVAEGIITRYTAAGDLDAAFGDGGSTDVPLGNGFGRTDWLIPLPGGKFLVSGDVGGLQNVWRFNADGSLDSSYGTAGRVTVPAPFGRANDVALGPVGQLALMDATSIALVSPDGSSSPIIVTANVLSGVGVQADGKILAVGGFGGEPLPLRRFLSNGAVDTTFGGGDGTIGIDVPGLENPLGGIQSPVGILQQSDGKLVIGMERADAAGINVVRYNLDGSVDTTFDGDGVATASFGEPLRGTDVRIDPDGNIVVVGAGNLFAPGDHEVSSDGLSLARFGPDGALDEAFGRVFLGDAYSARISDLAVQADGKVLLRGEKTTPSGEKVMHLMRFAVEGTDPAIALDPGGTLAIAATAGDDVIDVVASADARFDGSLRASRNDMGKVFDAADVSAFDIDAGDGDDLVGIAGLAIPATIAGGGGIDRIAGGDAPDSITAGDGYDRVDGGPGNDTIDGGDGRDWIRGQDGNDTITGGAWSDFLDGGAGDDVVLGGGFHDRLTGGPGADSLGGSAGDDAFFSDDGESDVLSGGGGTNTATSDDDDLLTNIDD